MQKNCAVFHLPTIYYTKYADKDGYAKYNNITIYTMKRIYRNDMQQAQKDKIAAANLGKKLSQSTKDKISQSMQKYWQSLPFKPDGGEEQQAPNPYED